MKHSEADLINDYVDGFLSPEKKSEFEAHLKTCMDCYETITWTKILLERASSLPAKISPPHNLWMDIYHELRDIRIREKNIIEEEAEVQSFGELKAEGIKIETEEKKEKKETPQPQKIVIKKQAGSPIKKIILSILISASVIIGAYYLLFSSAAWEISRINGDVKIGNSRIAGKENFSGNKLIKTELNAKGLIKVPDIGTVEIDQNSRLKRTGDFEFELINGKIKADKRNAKEFLEIKIPSADVKDFNLGGSFSLEVNSDGNSLLTVEEGWVRISNINRESIIPSKHFCEIRKGIGPGIPYSFSASPDFIKVLNVFNFSGDETVLPALLSLAKKEDSVSLWHLLQKVDEADRSKVFSVLANFIKPPDGASQEDILKMNRGLLLQWLEVIDMQI